MTLNTRLLAHNSLRQRKADGGFQQLWQTSPCTPCATAGDAVAAAGVPHAGPPAPDGGRGVPETSGRLSPRSALEGRRGAEAHTSLQVLYASRLLLGGTAGEVK